MTTPEQVEMAQAAVALTRYLADHPDADDELVEELYDATCLPAVAHLAAALVRDTPEADEYLGAVALHLATQSSNERSAHREEVHEEGDEGAAQAASGGDLVALVSGDRRPKGQGVRDTAGAEPEGAPQEADEVEMSKRAKKAKRQKSNVESQPVMLPKTTWQRTPTTVLQELERPVIAARHAHLRKWAREQEWLEAEQHANAQAERAKAAPGWLDAPAWLVRYVFSKQRQERA